MRKIFKFSINFWPILTILFVLFLLFNLTPLVEIAEAATIDDFKFNIEIPGMPATAEAKGNLLGAYIQAWFQFLLSVIGIIATVMIMIGGFKYLASQGDKGKIQDAQNMMISAITGLILAFGSVAILGLVNPKLLTLTMPPIAGIDYEGTYDKNTPNRTGQNPNGTITNPDGSISKCGEMENLDDKVKCYEEGANGPKLEPTKDPCCNYADGCNGNNTCQWYVGYGSACGTTAKNASTPPSSCQKITPEQAEALIKADLEKAKASVEAIAKAKGVNLEFINDARMEVLTDMAYTLGPEKLSNFNNMWDALKTPDFHQAAAEIQDSRYFTQTGQRSNDNFNVMFNGE